MKLIYHKRGWGRGNGGGNKIATYQQISIPTIVRKHFARTHSKNNLRKTPAFLRITSRVYLEVMTTI